MTGGFGDEFYSEKKEFIFVNYYTRQSSHFGMCMHGNLNTRRGMNKNVDGARRKVRAKARKCQHICRKTESELM